MCRRAIRPARPRRGECTSCSRVSAPSANPVPNRSAITSADTSTTRGRMCRTATRSRWPAGRIPKRRRRAFSRSRGSSAMSDQMNPADRAVIEVLVATLETAWNVGDAEAFGAPFAPDADFVTIRAEHFRGRDAIATSHAKIFASVYAGSVVRYTVESVRLLRPDVALLHVQSVLDAPSGPLAGKHMSRFSAVLTRDGSGWQFASFHNTAAPST